jgi:hypothetical protein
VELIKAGGFAGTLEAYVYPQKEGLRFQGRYYYDEMPFRLPPTPETPDADALMALLPAPTYTFISGRDLAGFWQQLSLFLELFNDTTRNGLDAVRAGFQEATGLDLDRDVFSWMDREFAIAFFPAKETPFQFLSPNLDVGMALLLQTSDRPTSERALAAFDELMQAWYIQVIPRTVNDTLVVSWEFAPPEIFGETSSFLSHGWANEDTLVVASGTGAIRRLVNPIAFDPLSEHFTYRLATESFPQPNNGYFYLNMGSTLSLIYQVFYLNQPDAGLDEIKGFLGSVYSLSLTTTQTDTFFEVDGLVGLAHRRPD